MKKFSLKIACIFIIVMYCLAPLSALDLNQDDNNTKYINQDDDSGIDVKDVNVTKEKNNEETKNIDADVDDSKEVLTADADGSKDPVESDVDDSKNQDADENKNLAKAVDPNLRIHASDVYYGDKATVEIKANRKFTGTVYVSIHGDLNPKQVFVKNGYATVTMDDNLFVGPYTATVKFDGNENFKKSSSSTKFLVHKANPNLSVKVADIDFDEKATVKIYANKAFTGDVVLSLHGDLNPQKVHVENGFATVTIEKGLVIGPYTATVKFDGNENFTKSSSCTQFYVHKANPNLSVKVADITYGENASVEISANEKFIGDVYLSMYGWHNPQKVHVENGHATVTLDKFFVAGPYTIAASFNGNQNFTADFSTAKFYVHRADPNLSISVDDVNAGEKATAEITANELFSGNVYVSIDGGLNPQKVHVENGHATLTIDEDLVAGFHTANVSYTGKKNFKSSSSSTRFLVKANIDPNLSIKVDDITVGDKAVAVISANESLTGDASLYINGSKAVYPVSIIAGSGTVTIDEDLAAGDYNASVVFNGDDTFSAAESSTSFKVNEIVPDLADPKLDIKVKDISFGNKAVVSVSTDAKFSGNVGVDIGSKHYNVKVANGKGTVNVSGLAVGKYTAKASFTQTESFKASTKSTNFAVKKANVKLSAKAKTFKYSQKTKKYAVSLKDNKGKALKAKKVTLKVNGKTYTAKTNAKGVATFKLAKLNKVGSKNAVIKYAGDKSFNKASKKARITVKFDAITAGTKNKLMVKKIQRALKKNNFYISYKGRNLLVDGWYYKWTTWAVKKYQAAKGLKVSGKVDYSTARKLRII